MKRKTGSIVNDAFVFKMRLCVDFMVPRYVNGEHKYIHARIASHRIDQNKCGRFTFMGPIKLDIACSLCGFHDCSLFHFVYKTFMNIIALLWDERRRCCISHLNVPLKFHSI